MGMYTEININVELKKDVPKSVIQVLEYMLDNEKQKPKLPDHLLFETTRWEHMLTCDSYYFDADTHSTLRFDEIGNSYYLNVQSNLKNYDDEIEKFLDWIKQYVYTDGFWGHYRYEETNEPTLIFNGEAKNNYA